MPDPDNLIPFLCVIAIILVLNRLGKYIADNSDSYKEEIFGDSLYRSCNIALVFAAIVMVLMIVEKIYG